MIGVANPRFICGYHDLSKLTVVNFRKSYCGVLSELLNCCGARIGLANGFYVVLNEFQHIA